MIAALFAVDPIFCIKNIPSIIFAQHPTEKWLQKNKIAEGRRNLDRRVCVNTLARIHFRIRFLCIIYRTFESMCTLRKLMNFYWTRVCVDERFSSLVDRKHAPLPKGYD